MCVDVRRVRIGYSKSRAVRTVMSYTTPRDVYRGGLDGG